MIASLILGDVLHARIADEARKAMPRECCGLIEGVFEDSGARATAVHAVRNLAEVNDRFEIDPAEHIRLLRQARDAGRAIIGCYHSHPGGEPKPSSYDRENASDEEFVWLIAAVSGEQVEMRAFACHDGAFSPAPFRKSESV